MTVQAIAAWLEASPPGELVRSVFWAFPMIEAAHLMALAALGASVVPLDLALLGLAPAGTQVSHLERATRYWTLGALAALFLTGSLLLVSEAEKVAENPFFRLKLLSLTVALTFCFLVRNPLARREGLPGPRGRIAGACSLLLWLLVAACGRITGSV